MTSGLETRLIFCQLNNYNEKYASDPVPDVTKSANALKLISETAFFGLWMPSSARRSRRNIMPD